MWNVIRNLATGICVHVSSYINAMHVVIRGFILGCGTRHTFSFCSGLVLLFGFLGCAINLHHVPVFCILLQLNTLVYQPCLEPYRYSPGLSRFRLEQRGSLPLYKLAFAASSHPYPTRQLAALTQIVMPGRGYALHTSSVDTDD